LLLTKIAHVSLAFTGGHTARKSTTNRGRRLMVGNGCRDLLLVLVGNFNVGYGGRGSDKIVGDDCEQGSVTLLLLFLGLDLSINPDEK